MSNAFGGTQNYGMGNTDPAGIFGLGQNQSVGANPQAFYQGTTAYPNMGIGGFNKSNDVMFGKGGQYASPEIELSAFGPQMDANGANTEGGIFDGIGMDQFAAGAGIAKDLYGMYAGHKGLGLAKDQLNMQKQAYADNKANRDRFVGNTQKAFG